MCKITEATVVMFLATVYLRLSLSYDAGGISRGLGLRMADTRAKRKVNGFARNSRLKRKARYTYGQDAG